MKYMARKTETKQSRKLKLSAAMLVKSNNHNDRAHNSLLDWRIFVC